MRNYLRENYALFRHCESLKEPNPHLQIHESIKSFRFAYLFAFIVDCFVVFAMLTLPRNDNSFDFILPRKSCGFSCNDEVFTHPLHHPSTRERVRNFTIPPLYQIVKAS